MATTSKKSVKHNVVEAKKVTASAKLGTTKARTKALRARAVNTPVAGFMNFIREQGVVGLAVGLAIGTAAGDTVKKLVEGFIAPVVQFIVGSHKGLDLATWHLELWGRSADFKWGAFVSSLITLIATALVIYLILHALKLDRLDRKKD